MELNTLTNEQLYEVSDATFAAIVRMVEIGQTIQEIRYGSLQHAWDAWKKLSASIIGPIGPAYRGGWLLLGQFDEDFELPPDPEFGDIREWTERASYWFCAGPRYGLTEPRIEISDVSLGEIDLRYAASFALPKLRREPR